MSDHGECGFLSARFYHFLDARDYRGLVGLFAPGGVWHRQGHELSAPDGILAALGGRSPRLAIRHVLSNVDVRRIDEDNAQVHAYAVVYRFEDAEPEQSPVPLRGPNSLLVVQDDYVRYGGVWKMRRKDSRRVMVAA